MAFSFVHIADVHLDTPFKSRDGNLRSTLRHSIRQAFEGAVDLAINRRADAILIAGDLFDNDTLSFTTEKFVIDEFRRLDDAKIRVFYAPGNHDPYGAMYRMNRIQWPGNVHVFNQSSPLAVPVKGKDGHVAAVVAGAGHEGKREGKNLVKAFPKAQDKIPHIGLIHALVGGARTFEGHERYAPCSLEDLECKGYSYWALGHVHTRACLTEGAPVIYPGNLVGRNPSEDGPRGAYYVEIDDEGRALAAFHPISPVVWETICVDGLSEAASLESLEQNIYESVTRKLEEKDVYGRLLLRVALEGPCPLYKELENEEDAASLTDSLKSLLDVEFLEIAADGIVRPVDPDMYRNGPHVLGTALSMVDRALCDDEFLLKLKPEKLGKHIGSEEEAVEYLRSLLKGLDYEACERMTGGGLR